MPAHSNNNNYKNYNKQQQQQQHEKMRKNDAKHSPPFAVLNFKMLLKHCSSQVMAAICFPLTMFGSVSINT